MLPVCTKCKVRNEIIRNPRKSIRKIAVSTGIKKWTLHVILKKKLKLHPYKMQIVQYLNESDYRYFARILRKNYAGTFSDRTYTLGNILFNDEAHFHINGCVKKIRDTGIAYFTGNMWYNNPRERHQNLLHRLKTTFLGAISASGVIGPSFFNQGETVTAPVYGRMINEFLLPQLQLFRLQQRNTISTGRCHSAYSLGVNGKVKDSFSK